MLTGSRFVDCEKWREEIKLDDTVPTWEYPEKEDMFKYYPQYYHKTDKVRPRPSFSAVKPTVMLILLSPSRTAAPCTSSSSAGLT